MSNVETVSTVLGGAVSGGIVFGGLWRLTLGKRLTEMEGKLRGLAQSSHDQSLALVQLTEAQKAMLASSRQMTDTHTRMVDDTEEMDDAIQQLQLATQRLQERMRAYEQYRQMTHPDQARGG